jgi:flagellar biosynthetic protein FlhB
MAGDDDHSAEDRTEVASEKRLLQAREAGQLPVSRDAMMLALLGGGALGAVALLPLAGRHLAEACAGLLANLNHVNLADGIGLDGQSPALLGAAMLVIAAVGLPAAGGCIACGLLQTQFYIGGAPLRFQFSRISPSAGMARIFSFAHLLDFLKACGKLGLLCLLAWSVLSRSPAAAIATIGSDIGIILPAARGMVENLARPLLMFLAVMATADVFIVRFRHGRSMRMTREQQRLELRESEGDPFIKLKLKRIRMQRSKRRMMAKVKTADVVITNPTHYAIALSYERGGNNAPRVVAKGADFVAARIREEAELHRVPLVPNAPLARALYQVELDSEIPAEHYRAVAEVIAFVWSLKTRLGGARGRR